MYDDPNKRVVHESAPHTYRRQKHNKRIHHAPPPSTPQYPCVFSIQRPPLDRQESVGTLDQTAVSSGSDRKLEGLTQFFHVKALRLEVLVCLNVPATAFCFGCAFFFSPDDGHALGRLDLTQEPGKVCNELFVRVEIVRTVVRTHPMQIEIPQFPQGAERIRNFPPHLVVV